MEAEKIEPSERRIGALESRLAAIEARLLRNEHQASEHTVMLHELRRSQGRITSDIETIRADIESRVFSSLARVEKMLRQLTGDDDKTDPEGKRGD